MSDSYQNFHQAQQYLESLMNMTIAKITRSKHPNHYIERTKHLAQLVGNPQQDIKFVHVTGTAGKGSVSHLVQTALTTSGKRTGLYTSPFCTSLIEKISIDGTYIDPKIFTEIVEEIKPAILQTYTETDLGCPTYFETLFIIALLYWKKLGCEWAVVEVGLGGRYDATNIIKNTEIALITNIDYDHTHILGKTLSKIARDKAGIIKHSSTLLTTEQRPHLLKIFKQECRNKQAKYQQITYEQGNYKSANDNLCLAVCKHLNISQSVFKESWQQSQLPCRFEVMPALSEKLCSTPLAKQPIVVLDGAHNHIKIQSTIHNLKKNKSSKRHLIIGFKKGKDIQPLLKLLIPFADQVTFTRFLLTTMKCIPPAQIYDMARPYLKHPDQANIELDPKRAMLKAVKHGTVETVILVTGSFYLAGELRRLWYPESWILEHRHSFPEIK